MSAAHCFFHSYKLLSEQKHFQTDAVNPGSGVTKSERRKSVATTRWSLPCSGWATVITVIASMDCPAKLPPALLRNHCRNRSVSLKYSVDTPQHKDFFLLSSAIYRITSNFKRERNHCFHYCIYFIHFQISNTVLMPGGLVYSQACSGPTKQLLGNFVFLPSS